MITTTREFEVEGESVLELGAGAALPGIIAAKAGARKVSFILLSIFFYWSIFLDL